MKLVVGLGNPGDRYRNTRHNVGFEVVAELSRRHDADKPRQKHDAEIAEIFFNTEKVLLMAPLTYMNESGRSVAGCVSFYDLPLDDLLVVCDDLNLDSARLRLRTSGSFGGQKGLQDVIRRLGTESFARLRIGIGRPPGRMSSSDYVLGRFSKQERAEIDDAVQRAADGVELWLKEGVEAAMNAVNAPPADE
ncbi:MAG: aminoacyl-tRNA hydrolase [Planctomycetaceae bacterium]